jgi:hypothetical protein
MVSKDLLIAGLIGALCTALTFLAINSHKSKTKTAEAQPPPPSDGVKDETPTGTEMRLGSVIRSWVKILPTGERILVIVDDNSRQSHFILLPPLPKVQVEKP